ncbi:Holliday junction branch migration protein RuvA [Candidatus Peregrinibacteria bacterium]|nr:Holliday junction branch migration protein RuvA [Candidatus Peregrinibacteria bacterium]
MIAHLRGIIHRLDPTEITVDVSGVGYLVSVPLDVWDNLKEAEPAMLWISTYVREDRFDLYGFPDRAGRTIFEEFIAIPGIGPKLGLELCAVPRAMILRAIQEEDVSTLTSIKGIGKKTAEKLLLELKSLLERKPTIFGTVQPGELTRSEFDQDAISALSTLGYDTPRIIRALKELPSDLKSTEERVAAALRSL